MVSASPAEHEQAHGLAIFATATFLLGMGLIVVLERVGAPAGFVQALGPLLALLGLSVIGVLTRAPNLLDFLAARRSASTFYGGLAFAATAAGLVMAMGTESGGLSSLPWRGVAIGSASAALLVAPALRSAKASALADVLATAFPAAPTRIVLALAIAATGLLTAIAGLASPRTRWSARSAPTVASQKRSSCSR
jgi:cation/acetate symporter